MKTINPEATHGIIHRVQGSVFTYQGWPSVARDENGTLYAVVSGFRVQHVCPFGKTVMHISKNNGKTWTPPIVINDTYMDDRDAGILYLGNGKLVVSWFTHSADFYHTVHQEGIIRTASPAAKQMTAGALEDYHALADEDKIGGSYIRISEDYGVTWGDIIRVPVSAPHGPNVCKDGTLIYLGNKMYPDGVKLQSDDENDRVAFCHSKDGGYTWEEVHVFKKPEWMNDKSALCEPYVIELPSGRLFGTFRVENSDCHRDYATFSIASTYSDDGGKTWSDIVHLGVNGAPPHLCQHSSGALIMAFGRRSEVFGEYAWISYDGGETWAEEYAIDINTDNGDLGYPATVELDDGSLLTVYYQQCPEDKYPSLLYTNWKLQK